jgi:DNA (cytosine-5)-methyltransferase 1
VNELALFAGAGGGILGGRILGWRTVCAVEWDEYARAVLMSRQDDGSLEPFPIWDDVRTFDGTQWRGVVDVVSGGFPCQDISVAGKGSGLSGERSGLWREMARIIREVRPRFVFVENSPALTGRGLDVVLGDLASLGYDAEWGVLGASSVGAPHRRERIWILARLDSDSDGGRCEKLGKSTGGGESRPFRNQPNGLCPPGWWAGSDVAHSDGRRGDGADDGIRSRRDEPVARGPDAPDSDELGAQIPTTGRLSAIEMPERSRWWSVEPDVGRVAHGVAYRVDRLKCLGNGQVPQAAAASVAALARRGGWA